MGFSTEHEFLQPILEKGFDGITEVMQNLLNLAMKFEREKYLRASAYQRTADRVDHANGYKPRTLHSAQGEMMLSIPQSRNCDFYPSCLERGMRSQRAIRIALAEMYIHGEAEVPLKLIRALYQIEREAKERAERKGTETALFQFRKAGRKESDKIAGEFFDRCRSLRESERPSSPVSKAASYALNIEAELKKFLNNPKLNIDNNPAERLIRGVALIRKNCLFAGSAKGGQNLAILYSFAASCKANSILFGNWLAAVLPHLASAKADEFDNLLPHRWQKSKN